MRIVDKFSKLITEIVVFVSMILSFLPVMSSHVRKMFKYLWSYIQITVNKRYRCIERIVVVNGSGCLLFPIGYYLRVCSNSDYMT